MRKHLCTTEQWTSEFFDNSVDTKNLHIGSPYQGDQAMTLSYKALGIEHPNFEQSKDGNIQSVTLILALPTDQGINNN